MLQDSNEMGGEISTGLQKQSITSEKSAHLRKFTASLSPGTATYDLKHNLGTVDVLVQTRIAGNVREGGIRIVDANTVRIIFGGALNEPMDVVIIG